MKLMIKAAAIGLAVVALGACTKKTDVNENVVTNTTDVNAVDMNATTTNATDMNMTTTNATDANGAATTTTTTTTNTTTNAQ